MNHSKLFFYGGIIPGLLLNFIGAFFYFILYADSGYANAIYGAVKVVVLIWPLFWLLVLHPLPKVGEAVNVQQSIAYGVISGALILLAGFGVYFAFQSYFQQFEPLVIEKIVQMDISERYILFAVVISIFHSLLEEFYWRYFLFRGLLLRFRVPVAAMVSSIGFSLHHFVVLSQYFPPVTTALLGGAVGIGGFLWCLLYAKTGSLLGSWISHIAVDAGIFLVGYLIVF